MFEDIETGGKQLNVEVGQTIWVEKLDAQEGEEVVFDKVLLVGDKELKAGTPYVEGATVTAKVEKQGRGKKITIYKYVAKSGSSHRKKGHRQPYTRLSVESINA